VRILSNFLNTDKAFFYPYEYTLLFLPNKQSAGAFFHQRGINAQEDGLTKQADEVYITNRSFR
jgi:hypothetical protein